MWTGGSHAEALAHVQGEQIKELCRKDPGKALGMAIMLYAAINRDKTE